MEEVRLDVETVTPLFISGADQRNIENEGLRAPSLRGLLRWWFRAIMGGVKFSSGDVNYLKSVKEEEERIFGATDKQSKVFLSVSPMDLEISTFHIGKRGIRYLSYGISERPYIVPGSKFKLRVLFRPSLSDNEKKKIVAALWLLLNLGNVGSKSRKGFGSLRTAEDLTIDGIEFKCPNSLDELETYLKRNIRKCFEVYGWNGNRPENHSMPQYSIIASNYWKMKILSSLWSSPIDAINHIGEKIREYREDRGNPSARHTRRVGRSVFPYWVTKDYNSVKSIYTASSPSTPKGSIFGIPHQFQFQSINKKAVVRGLNHERRSSPLHIKIWKMCDNYVIGLQLFKSLFLPENKLRISDLRNPHINADVDLPSYDYLESFFNELSGRWLTL